jgi:hypothetical protein
MRSTIASDTRSSGTIDEPIDTATRRATYDAIDEGLDERALNGSARRRHCVTASPASNALRFAFSRASEATE